MADDGDVFPGLVGSCPVFLSGPAAPCGPAILLSFGLVAKEAGFPGREGGLLGPFFVGTFTFAILF